MKADQTSGIIWSIFSLLAMYGSYRLKIGSPVEPGPGFFPFLCSSFMLLMTVIVLTRSFFPGRGLQKKISEIWKDVPWHRPFAIAMIMLGYNLLLDRLGFIVTAFMLLFMLLKTVEKQSWKKTLIITFSAILACNFIFLKLLKVPLPRGILGF